MINTRQTSRNVFFICSMTALVLTIALLPALQASAAVSVRDFGAVGDGKTLDTQAIQKTIDAAAKAGGDTVNFPAGTYLSGTIYLRSHITLHLQAGAVLLGSERLEDYPMNFCKYPSYSDKYCVRALLWGEGLENIALVGRGVIDGQGKAFLGAKATDKELQEIRRRMPNPGRYSPRDVYVNRPYVIRLISCRDVLVEGLTLRNSPMWMQHYLHCDHLTVRNIRVFNQVNRNNDMIDIDSCRNVIVTGCYGDTDDDALTLKSTGPDPTENVTISDCILRSHVNAIKMGTESTGGFKNITITNCVILSSEYRNNLAGGPEGFAGIALEAVDGGSLERVTISNITMTGIATPLFMRLGNRARPHTPDAPKPAVGVFRNVNVDNVVATGVGNLCSSITGIPNHRIEGVNLSNITFHCAGGIKSALTDLGTPEVETKYPESRMFGRLPAYGFYCRHVKGLSFRNVQVGFEQSDRRYSLVCDDVENLTLDSFQPMIAPNASAAVLFKDVRRAFIRGCNPPGIQPFIKLRGNCEGIM